MKKAAIACLLVLYFVFLPVSGGIALVRISDGLTGDMVCDCGDYPTWISPDSESKSLKSRANDIVRIVRRPGMDDFDLALALNDWIVDNTQYKSHTTGALQVLDNGYASCSGYANAYCALLNAANIPYKRIVGKVFRFTHVWNLVKLGGNWYHVDVRMNDSSKSHLYFALSSQAISENHSAFGRHKNCDAFEYNYGYHTGMYDEAIAHIERLIGENFSVGNTAFMISLVSDGCPDVLSNPIERSVIIRAIEARQYDCAGESHHVKLTTVDGAIAVSIDRPIVRISSLTFPDDKIKLVFSDLVSAPATYQLTATILPANATNPVIFWKSRNEKIATVDQNGLVTFKKYGKVKIQALSKDYSKKIATCEFTVKRG